MDMNKLANTEVAKSTTEPKVTLNSSDKITGKAVGATLLLGIALYITYVMLDPGIMKGLIYLCWGPWVTPIIALCIFGGFREALHESHVEDILSEAVKK